MTEYNRPTNPIDKSFLMGALIGAAAGVVATLLLAPDSGEKTRKRMKKTLQKVKKGVDNLHEQVAQEGFDIKENVKDVAHKMVDSIEKEAKKSVNEAARHVAETSQDIAAAKEVDEQDDTKVNSSGIRKPRRPKFFKGV